MNTTRDTNAQPKNILGAANRPYISYLISQPVFRCTFHSSDTPSSAVTLSLCESITRHRSIEERSALWPLALHKTYKWRDHMEGLLDVLGRGTAGLRNAAKIQDSSLDARKSAGPSWMLQGVSNLLDKACEWHEGISEIKSSAWKYELPSLDSAHDQDEVMEGIHAMFRRRSSARRMRILSKALQDTFEEGSEGVLSGSFMQAVLGDDDLKIAEAETMES